MTGLHAALHGTPDLQPKPTTEERFWSRVDREGPLGCWLWTGSLTGEGYGSFSGPGRVNVLAHRFSWSLHGGPLIEGQVLDHLCRVRHCVNPDHLESVSDRVNVLRGIGPTAINARKTHCKRGHEFTPENTKTYYEPSAGGFRRRCTACRSEWERAKRRRKSNAE